MEIWTCCHLWPSGGEKVTPLVWWLSPPHGLLHVNHAPPQALNYVAAACQARSTQNYHYLCGVCPYPPCLIMLWDFCGFRDHNGVIGQWHLAQLLWGWEQPSQQNMNGFGLNLAELGTVTTDKSGQRRDTKLGQISSVCLSRHRWISASRMRRTCRRKMRLLLFW